MADRSVKVTLRANVQDFKNQIGQAATSLDQLAQKGDKTGAASQTLMGRVTQSMQLQREQWTQAGTALTTFGVASAAALGGSAKAAADWETAFAGVLKTVDGSATELAALEEGLRAMALELPASHAEIAAVAEAAGQLGIETPNILDFTRTMIDMGESTNLSADQAATALARFANIMGTSQDEFSNIGSAVVDLGNNFATTEAEIVEMSLRLAGAGAQIGLSEADVMALATAMSSLGVEAEAGGTAMSQTMIQMRNAVDDGGASLDAFSSAAGMSSEAFATLFRSAPAEAIQAVVAGLGEMEAQGINTSGVLSEMGATGLRQADALRRLSSDATILGDAFRTANVAYGENNALAEEAAQRYETVAAQLGMAKNAIVDAGISLGSVFMPAIAGTAEAVRDAAGWFAALPDPIQGIIGGMGGLATVATLAGGGFLLLAPRVHDTVIAFKALRDLQLLQLAGGLSGVATSVAKFGAIGTGVTAIALLADSVTGINGMNVVAVDDLADALGDLADGARTSNDALTELFNHKHTLPWNVKEVEDFADLLEVLAPRWETLFGDGIGDKFDRVFDSGKIDKFRKEIEELDAGLVALWAAGDESLALEQYGQLVDLMIEAGASGDEAADAFARFIEISGATPPITEWAPGSAAFMGELAGATEEAADETGRLAGVSEEARVAAEQLGVSEEALAGILESQVGSIQNLIDKRRELAGEAMSQLDLERNRWEIMQGLTEAAEHQDAAFDRLAGTFDVTNDAGWKAHQMSQAWTEAMWDEAEAMAGRGEQYPEILARMEEMRAEYEAQIDGLQGVGDKADEVAESYDMIPTDIASTFDLDTAQALDALLIVEDRLVEFDGRTLTVNGDTTPLSDTVAGTLGLIADQNGLVTIDGNTYPADMTWAQFLEVIRLANPEANIGADDAGARRILDGLMADVDVAYDEVNVGADTSQARGDVDRELANTRGKSTTVNVGANMTSFNNSVGAILGRVIGSASVNITANYRGASGLATGGYVRGPGTSTSDSIPAWLSNGEYVVKASSVAKYGLDFLNRVNAGRYAQGGYVSARSASAPVVNVGAPSMEGLQLTGSLRMGDALVPIVDGRIEAAKRKERIVGRRP